MRFRASAILVTAFLSLTPLATVAQVLPYGQDFESMIQASPGALSGDGWQVFGTVYDKDTGAPLFGYGPFPAPNSSAGGTADAFSGVASEQGGPSQGTQQMSVFSDYQNAAHADTNIVESNVYREMIVTQGDVGTTWFFEFDAKRGDLVSPSTALAFIKTIDPASGYATTNFFKTNMTFADTTWWRYALSITIDSTLVGQLLQIGFANTSTLYTPSGVYYDNLNFEQTATLDIPQGSNPGSGLQLSVLGNPAIGNSPQVLSFALPHDSHVTVRVYDVGGRLVSTLVDHQLGAGPHRVEWQGRGTTGQAAAPGIYFAEVVAGTQREIVKLVRPR